MPKAKPVSLHPLTFDEAIKAIISVDPEGWDYFQTPYKRRIGSWIDQVESTSGLKNKNKTQSYCSKAKQGYEHSQTIVIDIPQTVLEEYRSNDKNNKRLQHRIYRLEWIAAIVAAGYAFVTFNIWRRSEATPF